MHTRNDAQLVTASWFKQPPQMMRIKAAAESDIVSALSLCLQGISILPGPLSEGWTLEDALGWLTQLIIVGEALVVGKHVCQLLSCNSKA